MKDLTPAFREALALGRSTNWTEASAQELMSTLAGLVDGRVDWDAEVPERWGRILTILEGSEASVVATVLISAPFVLIRNDFFQKLYPSIRSLACVFFTFRDWDVNDLRIDRSIISDHFQFDCEESVIDYEAMSASDLYYDTVS